MEWINIERKFPENESSVLVATRRYITIAHWIAKERQFDFLSREDALIMTSSEITHWMSLPELPKERHNDWERELLLYHRPELGGRKRGHYSLRHRHPVYAA
jgi:uncharacterized protein DUF551